MQRAEPHIALHGYKTGRRTLRIEFVKLQRHFIAHGDRILVPLEGRASAGKDGSIKRIVAHLTVAGTLALFKRCWYNRAGFERVMDFCTKAQYRAFMQSVPRFGQMHIDSGTRLLKDYLDISRDEQQQRPTPGRNIVFEFTPDSLAMQRLAR